MVKSKKFALTCLVIITSSVAAFTAWTTFPRNVEKVEYSSLSKLEPEFEISLPNCMLVRDKNASHRVTAVEQPVKVNSVMQISGKVERIATDDTKSAALSVRLYRDGSKSKKKSFGSKGCVVSFDSSPTATYSVKILAPKTPGRYQIVVTRANIELICVPFSVRKS